MREVPYAEVGRFETHVAVPHVLVLLAMSQCHGMCIDGVYDFSKDAMDTRCNSVVQFGLAFAFATRVSWARPVIQSGAFTWWWFKTHVFG